VVLRVITRGLAMVFLLASFVGLLVSTEFLHVVVVQREVEGALRDFFGHLSGRRSVCTSKSGLSFSNFSFVIFC